VSSINNLFEGDSCIILRGDDIFNRIEKQLLEAMKKGSLEYDDAISRALNFIEGERKEITDCLKVAADKVKAWSKILPKSKRRSKMNVPS